MLNPLDRLMKADVWPQVVDTVDDYFRVAREQPVQKSNGVVLDGRLETSYQISFDRTQGKDTTSGFERLQARFSPSGDELISPFDLPPLGIMEVRQKEIEDTDSSSGPTNSVAEA